MSPTSSDHSPREQGRTVVLATHFLGEAGRVADRMAVLDKGCLRAIGRPEELAATLWDGMPVDIDLGRNATTPELDIVLAVNGVSRCEAQANGLRAGVRDRNVVPAILAALHEARIAVFGAQLRQASMEDVYFALEETFTDGGGLVNGIQWPAVWAIVGKDIRAIRRSKAVVIPMLLVPTLLMIVLPLVIGYAARTASPGEGAGVILDSIPGKLAEPIEALPPRGPAPHARAGIPARTVVHDRAVNGERSDRRRCLRRREGTAHHGDAAAPADL